MAERIVSRQKMQASIEAGSVARTAAHQAKIARLMASRITVTVAGERRPQRHSSCRHKAMPDSITTRGTLMADDWANEPHPFPDGFKKIAKSSAGSLEFACPGRT
jgi:hypothetical protein